MEKKSSEINNNNNNNDNNSLSIGARLNDHNAAAPPKKKRRGAVQLIKVALFMIRRRSGKSKSVDVASRGLWNRLVGSMRPLHLQRSSSNIASPPHSVRNGRNDDVMFVEQQMSPVTHDHPSSSSSSSSEEDGMSSYASAANLQDLDGTESQSCYASAENLRALDHSRESETTSYEENGGDDMIDAKAEEFIAQFYRQIRLQRLNSIDRRYDEMIQRSID